MKPVQHLQSVASVPQQLLTAEFQPVNLGSFRITPAGLTIDGEPDFESCEQLWSALRTLERSLQFAIGDAVNYFERRWGEKASQIVDATGLTLNSVKVYAWAAEKVPPQNRMLDRGLSFSHHLAVAALNSKEQKSWLKQALGRSGEEPWPVSRLKAAVQDGSDLAPEAWFVLVKCRSEEDQTAVQKKLELEGREVKAIAKRGGSKKKLEAGE